MMKVLIESDMYDSTEVGVPVPTHFHPRTERDFKVGWEGESWGGLGRKGLCGATAFISRILSRNSLAFPKTLKTGMNGSGEKYFYLWHVHFTSATLITHDSSRYPKFRGSHRLRRVLF